MIRSHWQTNIRFVTLLYNVVRQSLLLFADVPAGSSTSSLCYHDQRSSWSDGRQDCQDWWRSGGRLLLESWHSQETGDHPAPCCLLPRYVSWTRQEDWILELRRTEGTQEPSFVTLSQIGDSLGEARKQPANNCSITFYRCSFHTMDVDRKMTENGNIKFLGPGTGTGSNKKQ